MSASSQPPSPGVMTHDELVAKGIFAAFDKHIKPPPDLEARLLALAEVGVVEEDES